MKLTWTMCIVPTNRWLFHFLRRFFDGKMSHHLGPVAKPTGQPGWWQGRSSVAIGFCGDWASADGLRDW